MPHFPQESPWPRPQRHCFNLIELLVTIVIVVLLMGMTVPSVISLLSGNKVQSAARDLRTNLQNARLLARASGQSVALIMPGPGSGTTSVPENRRFVAFRLAMVRPAAGNYDFSAWADESAWSYVPAGVAIMEADGDLGIQDSVDYCRLPEDLNYTKVDNVDLVALGGGSTADEVRAVVFAPSGRVRGDSLFITLGEAVYGAGTWDIRKPQNLPNNKSAANQISLEVNRFTGAVTFRSPENY